MPDQVLSWPDNCPTCGSEQINRTEPLWYWRTGQDCTDPFHKEADDD